MKSIELIINGQKHQIDADPETSLLEVLRDDLGMTGSKYGCGQAQCGACTVMIDGDSVRSCVAQLGDVTGKQITTIEGLEKDGKLTPLQQAFLDEDAMQCGYCTSGMLMSATSLLASNPHPTEADIVRHMQGNVCRCGTYPRIVAAIKRAAGSTR